jgi:pilus assembly protein CpaB
MRTKSLVLLLLALGCGLIASIGISQVIERNRANSGPVIEYEDIVVAAAEIKENEKLKAASIELKPFPKGTAPEGAYHSIEDALKVTQRLRTVIAKGEAILPNKFLDPNQSNTDRIPKGMRVVAIQADSQSAAGNLLKPDDRVDVLLHVPGNGQNQQAVVKTVLRNIRIYSVNDNTRAVSEGEVSSEKNTRYVTLLVTTEQQGVVMLAQHQGQIKLSLRHPDDVDPEDNNDIKSLGKVLTGNASTTTNNAEAEEAALKPLEKVSNSVGSFFDTLNEVAAKAKDQQPPVAPASAGTPPALPYETFQTVIIENSTPRVVDMMRDKKNPKGTWVSDGVKGIRLPRNVPSAAVAPTLPAGTTTPESLGVTTPQVESSVKNTTF